MALLELFSWWYGRGWLAVAAAGRQRFTKVSHLFSVPILVRTLFAPWRRIVTYPGSSIEARFRAFGDNLVSRAVGFTVRAMVLFSAGVMLAGCALVALLQLIIWPLVPPAVISCMVLGVIG